MNEQELKMKVKLIEMINIAFGEDAFDDYNCYYGEQQVEHMADAAMAVIIATKEAQELMISDGIVTE